MPDSFLTFPILILDIALKTGITSSMGGKGIPVFPFFEKPLFCKLEETIEKNS